MRDSDETLGSTPIHMRSDAEIAEHLLSGNAPDVDESIFLTFELRGEDDAPHSEEDLLAMEAIAALSNIVDSDARERAEASLAGRLVEQSIEEIVSQGAIEGFLEGTRRMSFLPRRPRMLSLTRSDISTSAHAICDSSSVLALAVILRLPGTEELPRVGQVACIPPAAFGNPRVASLYAKYVESHSTCLFDQRKHPGMSLAEAGLGGVRIGKTLPDELYLPFYQELLRSSMPSLSHLNKNKLLAPASMVVFSWTLKHRTSAFLAPGDRHGFRQAVKRMFEDTSLQGTEAFYARGLDVCARDVDEGELPSLVAELVARDMVLSPIWQHVLPLCGKSMRDIGHEQDVEGLWEEHGIRSYLEALASGVPMEDLLA